MGLQELKSYVDYQLYCHEEVMKRLKNKLDFLPNSTFEKEWAATFTGKKLLWEIKIQLDEIVCGEEK